MARPSFTHLLPATLMRALPGIAALAALAVIDVVPLFWAAIGAIACLIIALVFALPVSRDLALLTEYGETLAAGGQAAMPELSGWAPAAELAASMRRIARESERRREHQRENMVASQLVFDALPQPLLLLDDRRRVLSLNRTARDMIGTDPSGSDLAAAFRDPRVLEAVDAVMATRRPRSVSLAVTDPVDRFFSIEIVALERPSVDGATVLIALYDLTARRRVEQMRADFIANASHELRTPLATLTGFIETLQGPARDDAEARENFLKLMHDQAGRMSRLVKDLLSLSAIELNEHTAPATPVDLGAIVQNVIATLQLEARKKMMVLQFDADDELPLVAGDGDQLTQLFQNLIDNAIKYGREGTQVRIGLHRGNDVPPAMARAVAARGGNGVVRASVADTGEGIAVEHIPRLTERFYRVDTARSRAVGGTGLGLAIVKHIVNRHRGLLDIDSRQGQGSTFTVTLAALGPEVK